jgi:putative endonuclease
VNPLAGGGAGQGIVDERALARVLRVVWGMTSVQTVGYGKSAEDLACAELQRHGYAVLARRYRTRVGEIDIVAQDGATVVFVEVKARSDQRCGHPAEAVAGWKQRRIAAMAWDYLTRRHLHGVPCRFDVVAITGPAGGAQRVELIRAAFWVDS